MENDIWKLQQMVNVNDRATNFVMYYRETTAQSFDGNGDPICAAFQDQVVGDLENILSDQVFMPRQQAWLQNRPGIPGRVTALNADGNIPTPALPANKCLVYRYLQSTFPARHNNRVFISGVPDSVTVENTFTTTYLEGVVAALRNALLAPLTQLSAGGGIWTPVCYVNQSKIFDDADYPFVTGIVAHPVIYSQSPRTRRSYNSRTPAP